MLRALRVMVCRVAVLQKLELQLMLVPPELVFELPQTSLAVKLAAALAALSKVELLLAVGFRLLQPGLLFRLQVMARRMVQALVLQPFQYPTW